MWISHLIPLYGNKSVKKYDKNESDYIWKWWMKKGIRNTMVWSLYMRMYMLCPMNIVMKMYKWTWGGLSDNWDVVCNELWAMNCAINSVRPFKGDKLTHDKFVIVMQSYPPRALERRLQEEWTRDAREGPRILMSLRMDFRSKG